MANPIAIGDILTPAIEAVESRLPVLTDGSKWVISDVTVNGTVTFVSTAGVVNLPFPSYKAVSINTDTAVVRPVLSPVQPPAPKA